jgi:hypothetical protein
MIIRDFSGGLSAEDVFLKNLGYGFIEFEIAFFQHLKNRFRWIGFLQFDSVYLLALVLTVIFAFVIIKIRNRKIYKRWEREESLDEGG